MYFLDRVKDNMFYTGFKELCDHLVAYTSNISKTTSLEISENVGQESIIAFIMERLVALILNFVITQTFF